MLLSFINHVPYNFKKLKGDIEMNSLLPCITTLPITAYNNPSLGLLVQPFVMDVLSKRMGLFSVLSVNALGSKFEDGESSRKAFSEYVAANETVGVTPNFAWSDHIPAIKNHARRLFEELYSAGEVYLDKAKILECGCGKSETLSSAENYSGKKRTYSVQESICHFCGSKLKESERHAFFFKIPNIDGINAYPLMYLKELANMSSEFSGRSIMVSRKRATPFPLPGELNLFLDVDFAWQMYLASLKLFGFKAETVVVSNKSLLASLLAIGVGRALGCDAPSLVITPYFKFPPIGGNKRPMPNVIDLASFSSKALRIALAASFSWNRKESFVKTDMLELASKMSYRLSGGLCRSKESLSEALSDFDGAQISHELLENNRNRDFIAMRSLRGIA